MQVIVNCRLTCYTEGMMGEHVFTALRPKRILTARPVTLIQRSFKFFKHFLKACIYVLEVLGECLFSLQSESLHSLGLAEC